MSIEIIGYIASILIGVSLGLIGGGGSILTVPVLVYLMHINPLLATTSSLFIVGTTSMVGGLRAYSKNLVNFKAVTEFGIPSIFSIFITRHFILPKLPKTFVIANESISRDRVLMIFFAILMLAASFSMIRVNKNAEAGPEQESRGKSLSLLLLGLLVGVVTGLLGAGGGFLIIPSLVLFLRIPMKVAVGTSLLIIGINSLLGFLFSLKQFEYNWTVLIAFTALAIFGIFIGSKLSERIPGSSLKKGFGLFVLAMGLWIIIYELAVK